MNKRTLKVLDRVLPAIPMVGVAGLAAFTWWLVQSTAPTTGPAKAKVHSGPDYELQQSRIERYSAGGRLMGILDGQRMRHFEAGDRMEIDALQLTARDEEGQHVHAVARQGMAHGDTQIMELHGGARVVATPASAVAVGTTSLGQSPVVFEGEVLKIDTRARVISADQPVKITHSMGEVTAGALSYDQRSGVADLSRRVRGHYDAPAR